MARLSKKLPALCTDLPLENPDVIQKFTVFKQLLTSCFGPNGKLKQVHNNIGGHSVTTSTSQVLLQSASPSHPLLKVVATSVLSHVSRFSDCGLFTAILCFALIDQAKLSGLRRNVSISINEYLLDMCTTYLHQDGCGCKVKLDFSSSKNLITLAWSVISSKPACMLTPQEALHISMLAVQAFLLTVPCETPGNVRLGRTVTVSVEGPAIATSAVFPGLLVEVPDHLTLGNKHNLQPQRLMKMVLFSVSLSGDLFEMDEGTVEVNHGADMESEIMDQLLVVGQRAVKDQVELFVCQKVIHPVLQQYLNQHDVVVIERLGAALVEPLAELTGSQPLASLVTAISPEAYGHARGLNVKIFGSKRMLHLEGPGEAGICTMALCHRNQTVLSELKVACQKAEHVLRLTLREPSALLGGGCTETHLASYLRHKGIGEVAEAASSLGCSQTEYRLGLEAFCRSLESVARALEHDGGTPLVDLTHCHHWTVPVDVTQGQETLSPPPRCGCGLVSSASVERWTFLNTRYDEFSPAAAAALPGDSTSSQPRVLDCFAAKMNALQVAVETANLLQDIRYIIQDGN
ncbi:hypothetical protein NHX12_022003 [Muraenolepis orangiensis]|uniref:McKusick-Kaufman syndrome n=1 Tax=Muraenolepis orangiensis TaxID=630683 RepID=A0A9Q0IT12_9TELE|nr:hypothetical protein NHX12_022003 [Muraenolepis orangiensis]